MDRNVPEFLIEQLKKQYEEETTKKILEGYRKQRLLTFRVNTLKTTEEEVQAELEKNGIEFEKVAWSKQAFVIKNIREKEIKNLAMYQKGEIYLQSLSSMLPPIILEPKEEYDILDMAAAPGGKTTQIAALTQNKAHITACERNAIRLERLRYNIEKQGANSVYVMQIDSRKIDDFFSFDQILLDAPCSGSGTLSSADSNLEKTFTNKLINKSMVSQRALLKKAVTILKPGKEMVYSTCSILSCENEEVISEILKTKKVEIIPIALEGKEELPILPTKVEGTLCIAPTELYEGFFVAKLRKLKS